MYCSMFSSFGRVTRTNFRFLCFQVTVSNPAEVAKTRLQLQGELAKDGGVRVYNNALDVFAKTWRNEGIRGMQRGLGPAVSRALIRNVVLFNSRI